MMLYVSRGYRYILYFNTFEAVLGSWLPVSCLERKPLAGIAVKESTSEVNAGQLPKIGASVEKRVGSWLLVVGFLVKRQVTGKDQSRAKATRNQSQGMAGIGHSVGLWRVAEVIT
jgi:hypothetical protein